MSAGMVTIMAIEAPNTKSDQPHLSGPVVFHKKLQSISTNDFSWRLSSHCGGRFLSGMVRDKCYALKHTEVISGSFATHRTFHG